MAASISSDSETATVTHLTTFHNRNTGSDTVSETQGIGAARRWVYSRFQSISARNGGRLLPAYLQFTKTLCAVNSHRDVFAVLPGRDTTRYSVFIMEGHLDSRCENACDITCKANGADDNASGVAAVVELARVLSKYTFSHTLVFVANIGEEQGLDGAAAFAQYCQANRIPVKGVENDDIVSGILCGPKSSPPGCAPIGGKDSTDIRVFSAAINFSMNKAFARFIKGQYDQWLKPAAKIPMNIEIMDPTDRTGRGGDHEPFSQIDIPALRFTSAYENGEYLACNTLINAAGLVAAALGPEPPAFGLSETAARFIRVTVTLPSSPSGVYKVAVRDSGNNDFAVVYTLKDSLTFTVPDTKAGRTYFIALASLDGNGDQSLYSQEQQVKAGADGPPSSINMPPFGPGPGACRILVSRLDADRIALAVEGGKRGQRARIRLLDAQGRTAKEHGFTFPGSRYEATLFRGKLPPGTYGVSLEMDGKITNGRKLLLAP